MMTSDRSVVPPILLATIAVLIFTIQPGYLQGLVDLDGITGTQAGYIAAAEMAGYAITMILLSFVCHLLPWRPILIGCLLLQAVGNASCALAHTVGWLSVARFIAGLGSGGLISLAFSAIGMGRSPDRHFGFLAVWTLIYGAVGLAVLPALLHAIGLRGFHLAITTISLAALGLVRFMPAGDHRRARRPAR